MARMDKETTLDLIKVTTFGIITALFTGLLVMIIGNISFSTTLYYRATFADATGVVSGDDVRVAGVKVGSVTDVEIVDNDQARVSFTAREDVRLTTTTNAQIKYRNLVGQRYIALHLEDGGERLEENGSIPVGQTNPALDLTVLFNGFKPLFEALNPDDINRLSYEVVQVFQGEGGTVESLLATTASVTSTLAERDALIGDLLENLDYVLDHVADREQQLTDLINSFRTLVGGLKEDRRAILDSLEGISDLSVDTAALAQDLRAPLVEDIRHLRTLAGNLDRDKAELDRVLQVMPIKLNKLGRTTSYGSWTNMYLCHFKVDVHIAGNSLVPPVVYPPTPSMLPSRCNLGANR